MSFTIIQQTIHKHWTLIQESASAMLRKNIRPKFVDEKQMTLLRQFLHLLCALKAGQIALQFVCIEADILVAIHV